MTSTDSGDLNGFSVDLPAGFIALPTDIDTFSAAQFDDFRNSLANELGIPYGNNETADMAASFAALGTSSGDEGIDQAALAIYTSPDDPERLIMVMMTSLAIDSGHDDPDLVIAGLTDILRSESVEAVHTISVRGQQAIVAINEEKLALTVGEESAPILQRSLTAWVPDTFTKTTAVLSFSSNNWQDWSHICTMCLDILDTFDWDQQDPAIGDQPKTIGRHLGECQT